MRSRRLLALIGAMLALALVVTACGDDDDDDGGGGEASRRGVRRRRRHDQGRVPVRLRGRLRLVLRADRLGLQPGADRQGRRQAGGQEAERGRHRRHGRRQEDRGRRLRLRRRHRRQGDRGDAPPGRAGGRGHPRRAALGRRGHRGRQLREGASRQDVHQRDRRRAGLDAQGAGAELLPLPPGRRAVVGGPRRLRVQRPRLEDGRDHRRRLLVPVHVAGRLRGRVLRDRRQDHEADLGAARREGLLVLHLADPGRRRRPLRRHRRIGPDQLRQAVPPAEAASSTPRR